jgi:hypothetical protein
LITLQIDITITSTQQPKKSALGYDSSELEVVVVVVQNIRKKSKNLCLPLQHRTILLHPVVLDATVTTRTIMASRAVAAAPAENGLLSVIHQTGTMDLPATIATW